MTVGPVQVDLPGTTNPPNRIHMEAMREPNASMKPMKSQTRAPASRDNEGQGDVSVQAGLRVV